MGTDIFGHKLQLLLEQKRSFKFLFVGDSDCGKTQIIQTYFQGNSLIEASHDPISITYVYDLEGSLSTFTLIDIRGTDDIAKASVRFKDTDVALFFYAINRPKSLETLRYQWIPRFRMRCSSAVKTILVGNKKDLRASGGLKCIANLQPDALSFFDGMKVKTCCNLDMFLECSVEDYGSISCLFQAVYSYLI